jgi:hypothetical protein
VIPVLSRRGITSIRPASSPQRDTGVSPDSLTTNSMSRKIVGWSSMKYSLPTDYPDIKMNQIPILVSEVL